jgi:hypothetical protein
MLFPCESNTKLIPVECEWRQKAEKAIVSVSVDGTVSSVGIVMPNFAQKLYLQDVVIWLSTLSFQGVSN